MLGESFDVVEALRELAGRIQALEARLAALNKAPPATSPALSAACDALVEDALKAAKVDEPAAPEAAAPETARRKRGGA